MELEQRKVLHPSEEEDSYSNLQTYLQHEQQDIAFFIFLTGALLDADLFAVLFLGTIISGGRNESITDNG